MFDFFLMRGYVLLDPPTPTPSKSAHESFLQMYAKKVFEVLAWFLSPSECAIM